MLKAFRKIEGLSFLYAVLKRCKAVLWIFAVLMPFSLGFAPQQSQTSLTR
jgi:hypothetical protein